MIGCGWAIAIYDKGQGNKYFPDMEEYMSIRFLDLPFLVERKNVLIYACCIIDSKFNFLHEKTNTICG
jgi:hypothetical protein